jgi:hypothetical protein
MSTNRSQSASIRPSVAVTTNMLMGIFPTQSKEEENRRGRL